MNTYTVTVDNYNPHTDSPETVVVQGTGATHDRDALIIWADPEFKLAAAVFRRWEHVTVERPEPQSAGPFSERDCTAADCLKHNGDKSAADAVDWQHVLECLRSPEVPDVMHASVVVRALQQAQLYVMQRANPTP